MSDESSDPRASYITANSSSTTSGQAARERADDLQHGENIYTHGDGVRSRFLTVNSEHLGKRLFIKRSDNESEAHRGSEIAGLPFNRRSRWHEVMTNEAVALRILRRYTSIPIPDIICSFEDRGCVYIIMEFVENAIMALSAPDEKLPFIYEQLDDVVRQLRQLRPTTKPQNIAGGPLILPARFENLENLLTGAEYAEVEEEGPESFVLSHGDLGLQNVLVDPQTYRIKAIIDLEYASLVPRDIVEIWRRRGANWPVVEEDPKDIDPVVDHLHDLARRKGGPAVPTLTRFHGPSVAATVEAGIPAGIAWSRKILGERSWLDKDMSIGTPLQLRLRHLDVGHDRAIPVTARSLLAHTFLTTRNSLAQRFEDMSVDLTEDFNYMNRMVKESSANAENHWQAGGRRATPMIEHSHLFALSAILPEIFADLGASQMHSSRHIDEMRRHLLERDKKEEAWKDRRNAETKKKLDEMIRESEIAKWKGYLDAASRLAQISWAALQLLDNLPTDDGKLKLITSRTRDPPTLPDPKREHIEHRIEDLLAGGNGEWIPIINDAVAEELHSLQDDLKRRAKPTPQQRFPIRKQTDPPRANLAHDTYPHPSQLPKEKPSARDFIWPPDEKPPKPAAEHVPPAVDPTPQRSPTRSRAVAGPSRRPPSPIRAIGSEASPVPIRSPHPPVNTRTPRTIAAPIEAGPSTPYISAQVLAGPSQPGNIPPSPNQPVGHHPSASRVSTPRSSSSLYRDPAPSASNFSSPRSDVRGRREGRKLSKKARKPPRGAYSVDQRDFGQGFDRLQNVVTDDTGRDSPIVEPGAIGSSAYGHPYDPPYEPPPQPIQGFTPSKGKTMGRLKTLFSSKRRRVQR